jgi:hypothetical protein
MLLVKEQDDPLCVDTVAMMLWRMMAAAAYGLKGTVGYGDSEEFSSSRGGAPPPLDPIDPAVVGSVQLDALWQSASDRNLSLLTESIGVLLDDRKSLLRQSILDSAPVEPSRCGVVGKDYIDHFSTLERSGLVRQQKQGIRFLSGYFWVPKGDLARAIFNGKRLSRSHPAPPPVNLASMPEILEQILQLMDRWGRIVCVGGDFRHWFHQLKAPKSLQCLFGLQLGTTRYCWTSLPMGWSWSPWLAQAVAWSIVSQREKQEPSLVKEEPLRSGTGLPRWLPTTSGKGFVVVYYDNYLMVTGCENEARAFEKRMLSERRGAKIKEGSSFFCTAEDLCKDGFVYLGVRIQGYKTEDCHKALDGLNWRAEKLPAWLEAFKAPDGARKGGRTLRQEAEQIGRILFCVSLGLGSFGTALGRRAISAAREVGRAASLHGWDEKGVGCDLSPLWGGVETSCAHERRRHASGIDGRERHADCVLATDASARGYGWILYRLEKTDNRDKGVWVATHDALAFAFRFEVTDERHIFLKELSTACAALSWAHASGYRRVRLVVDNSAVAFALKNRMTTSDAGMLLIDGHQSVLEEALLDVVLVISKDNPADCPSRGSAEGLPERSANMNKSLFAHQNGWQWASEKAAAWLAGREDNEEATLRHGDGA